METNIILIGMPASGKTTICNTIKNITEIYLWCESSLEEFYIKTGFQKVGNVYIETEL